MVEIKILRGFNGSAEGQYLKVDKVIEVSEERAKTIIEADTENPFAEYVEKPKTTRKPRAKKEEETPEKDGE